jgi:small nuclear ribonucleoprotein (snRNP)-like protein
MENNMPSSSAAAAPAPPKSSRLGLVIGCIVCLLLGLFLGHAITYHWMEHHHRAETAFSTAYQAVVLNNGAVYYGKLTGYGTRNPIMTDVFYIVSKTDPTTKQVSNMLVKRGKELHAPDRMYLNPTSIVMVEPVGDQSKVAQLISEASR